VRTGGKVLSSRVTGLLQPMWSIEDYGRLLDRLLDSGRPIVDVSAYDAGADVVWLRHDVELDLDAAREMAAIEHDRGVRSTYFVCVESPFLADDETGLMALMEFLADRDHVVACHQVLGDDLASAKARLAGLCARFPPMVDDVVSFHAPGVGVDVLAGVHGGAVVYDRMVADTCKYFSDATGAWRWGDPTSEDLPTGRPIQVLTHPFWWSAGTDRILRPPDRDISEFLPQFAARQRGTDRTER